MARSNHVYRKRADVPTREVLGRRTWTREYRYPWHSIKAWHTAPPGWWWRQEHKRARSMQSVEMRAEDPMVTPDRRLVSLYRWY